MKRPARPIQAAGNRCAEFPGRRSRLDFEELEMGVVVGQSSKKMKGEMLSRAQA
ncbi:MAG: hypothetical protein U1E61_15775 [Bradyrhizobium sp.]